MLVSTDYLPKSQHRSAIVIPPFGQSDIETWIKNRGEVLGTKDWSNRLAHALRATSGRGPQQTFSYSWSGEGTASWTPAHDAIQKDLVQSLLESASINVDVYMIEYLGLPDILGSARWHVLEEMYSFRHATVVRRFLQIHPHLVKLLIDAYPYLLELFGPDPEVALEVVSDPEVEDWDQLFAYICTPLPVNEALARLHRLDEEWFLDQLDRVNDLFNFSLECL